MLSGAILSGVCCALFAVVPVLPVRPGEQALPEPGPENDGLRLRLVVDTKVEKGADVHAVRLDLLNVGRQPVTLVAQWPYEQDTGDYAQFLASEVAFVTFPEVVPDSAQTAGGERHSPQPEYKIAPGGVLSVSWESRGRRLKEKDYYNTTPYFPTRGLFGVRARIIVVTKDGKQVLLTSNPVQVAVGASRAMPKWATGRVVSVRPEKKTAMIDLGTNQKIEKGDVFTIRYGLQASWRLTITQVRSWCAEGTVETVHHAGRDTPRFPGEQSVATLVPPSDVTASTTNRAPCSWATRPISCRGWRTPVLVSAWTTATTPG